MPTVRTPPRNCDPRGNRTLTLRRSAFVLALFAFLGVAAFSLHAQQTRPKRVLVISTGSRLAPGFITVDKELLQALDNIPGTPVEIYAENLDIIRFPTERARRVFSEYLTAKYADSYPDLVILVFVGNLSLSGSLLPQLFPRQQIIVAGLTEEDLNIREFGPLVGGVAQHVDPQANLDLILRVQPDTRRIVVLGGTADIDRHVVDRVRQVAGDFAGRIEFEFWDNRTMAQIRQGITSLPPHTVILFTRLFRDAAGQAFISADVGQSIAAAAKAPVYVMTDPSFGTGAVGGSLASVAAMGKRAGELSRHILTGSASAALPFEIRTESVPTFDWRALKRWGIAEDRLPQNSDVRYKPQTFWDEYRWYILAVLILLLVQSIVIIDLLIERRRRLRMQRELHESREMIDLAAGAGGLGLWARDLKSGAVWANATLRSLVGMEKTDPIQMTDVFEYFHPQDRARVIERMRRAEEGDVAFEGEVRIVLPDRTVRWLLAKGRSVPTKELQGRRRMGVVLDITERKRAEEELEKERAFLRQVIDAVPNFIFAKDREGRFTLANRALADAYGTTVENLIGKTDADFNTNRVEIEFFRRVDREVIDASVERFIPEERLTDTRGQVRWLQTVKRPIMRNGTAQQILGASTDITRRKETELQLQELRAELAHVARISTMGELAASLAHELNQPLTAMLSNAQAALRFLANNPADIDEVREILEDIVADNNRAGEIIRRMRMMVKKENAEFLPLNVASLIREVIDLLHSDAIFQDVQISLRLDDSLPPILGDRVQLQQVVLNLLLNAFDAMRNGPAERTVSIKTDIYGERMIRVSVRDSGTGLTEKLDKIVEPFYTTKPEGMGIGLSICRSIVETHNGHMWAENNAEERGATFYFTVPVAKPPPAGE